MSAGLLAVVFLVGFMIHEFDEIILIRRYLSQAENWKDPRGLFWRNRANYPSSGAIAMAIAEEFLLAGIFVGVAVFLDGPEMILGLLIPYCVHLIGHCGDAIIVKRWVPGSLTAVITLPILLGAGWWFIAAQGAAWTWVVIWAVITTVVFVGNLQFMYKVIMPATQSWLNRVYSRPN